VELAAKLLGNRVAVSPIVTVEPRRRKFHKPITLTIPVPQAANKGMINQYSGDAPTLRLLCSITGEFSVHCTPISVKEATWWARSIAANVGAVLCSFQSHNLGMRTFSLKTELKDYWLCINLIESLCYKLEGHGFKSR
jgi:hypothetical protein